MGLPSLSMIFFLFSPCVCSPSSCLSLTLRTLHIAFLFIEFFGEDRSYSLLIGMEPNREYAMIFNHVAMPELVFDAGAPSQYRLNFNKVRHVRVACVRASDAAVLVFLCNCGAHTDSLMSQWLADGAEQFSTESIECRFRFILPIERDHSG